MHNLLRPRHLALTAFVFLLAGGTIGAAGLLGAEATEDQGTFTFAAPMAGDEARYTITGGPVNGMASFNLTWLPDAEIVLPDRTKGWYNPVRVVEATAGSEPRVTDNVYHLVPGTHDSVAYAQVHSGTTTTDGRSMTMLQERLDFDAREGALPCGFVTPWQGQTVALSQQQYPGAMCWMVDNAIDHLGHYELSAFIEASDMVVVKAYRGDLAMTFWYQADIPYPVKVVEEDGDDDAVWTLTAFERGTESVRREPDTRVVGVPALRWSTTPAWGVDTAGLDLPLQPQTAWEAARNDPQYATLRDYLASHPDAYVVEVRNSHFHDPGRDEKWHSWSFQVTDGDEYVDVHVRFIEDGADLIPRLPGQATGRWVFSDRGVEDANGWGHPDSADIPDRLPTAASLVTQWTHHRGPDYASQAGNFVYISHACYIECDKGRLYIEAGYDNYRRDHTDTLPVAGEYNDRFESSVLAWRSDDDGLSMAGYREHTQDWYPEGNPPQHVGTIAPQAVSLSTVGGWRMLTPQEAAVAGVGALLVGLLYFFAPVLKTGALGLFSRIQTHELLENPQRQRLVERIEAEPGVHHQALVRELDIGKGATEHHLRKLHEGGQIIVHKSTGYTCYFPKNTDRRALAAAPALKSAAARQIVDMVRNTPGIMAVNVRKAIGISPSTMHHHLKRLQDAGVVTVVKAGNGQALHVA